MDGSDASTSIVRAESFLDAVEADVRLIGHTHRALLLELPDGRVIANPGTLLRVTTRYLLDEGGPTPCQLGVLELPSKRFNVHRAKDGA